MDSRSGRTARPEQSGQSPGKQGRLEHESGNSYARREFYSLVSALAQPVRASAPLHGQVRRLQNYKEINHELSKRAQNPENILVPVPHLTNMETETES